LFGGFLTTSFIQERFDKYGTLTQRAFNANMLNNILFNISVSNGLKNEYNADFLLGCFGLAEIGDTTFYKILWFTFSQNKKSYNETLRVTDPDSIPKIVRRKKGGGKTFVIFYSASSVREKDGNLFHPIDKNAGWVNTAKAYSHLIDNGIPKENIFLLYKDADPDMDDPIIQNIKQQLQEEMNLPYSHLATEDNLKAIFKGLKKIIDENDSIWLFINTHGGPRGYLLNELEDTALTPYEIRSLILDSPSKNNLVLVDSCYSGAVIAKINAPGTYISSVKYNVGWIDRELSFTETYVKNLFKNDNDKNNDGKISFEEAFQAAEKEYSPKLTAKLKFINGEYQKSIPFMEKLLWKLLDLQIGTKGCIIKR